MALKHAYLRQVGGTTFAVRGDSRHWVMMDTAESAGGTDAGARPKELVLFALGGCTSVDVVNILKRMHAPLRGFAMNIAGEERDEHPRIFTAIHIEYIFYGDGINPEHVERAIELSNSKYCAVSAMLHPTVKITHSYRIEPSAAMVPEAAVAD